MKPFIRVHFFFLPLFLLFISVQDVQAQQLTSFRVQNASLSECLKQIEKQTGLGYLSKGRDLGSVKGISYTAENTDVRTVLQAILANTGLTFEIDNGVILILDKTEPVKSTTAQSQATMRVVTGTITDSGQLPLEGTTVAYKGSSIFAFSDKDGNFSIRIPDNNAGVLLFSFISMKTKEVAIGERSVVNVTMEEEAQTLSDVVVTGYANIKKESFTGTSTKITKDELLRVSQGSVLNALQAFDPSMRIAPNLEIGSNPNVMPEYYIRGQSGIGVRDLDVLAANDVSRYALLNNPNLPIFIMDGYEVSMEKVFDLDPNRLSSITILKDAAATAMYGSRAANGIVVIETLAPQQGKLRVSYNFTGSLTVPDLSDYNLMNAREKLDAEVAAGLLDEGGNYYQRLNDYRDKENNILRGVDTYWLSQPLQTQFNYNNNLYIDGGSETIRFGMGLNFGADNGIMKESYRKRFGADLRVDYRLKNFQITDNVSYSQTRAQDSPYGSFATYAGLQPYLSPTDLDTGELLKTFQSMYNANNPVANPLYEATLGNFSRNGYNTITNNLSMNGYFLHHFQIKFQLSVYYKEDDNRRFTDPNSTKYNSGNKTAFDKGELNLSSNKAFGWNTNLLLMYNNRVGKHNMNFTLGLNAMEDQMDVSTFHYMGFPSAQLNDPKYAHSIVGMPIVSDYISRLVGGFIMGNYTFNDIYLLDLSVRTDGSSKFGSNHRFAPFWSFGAGINLHKYAFLRDNKVINNAKIRANYGQMGRVGFPPYAARNMYEIMLDGWHPTGIGGVLIGMGNDNLTWDKANTLNIGFDLGLFKRLNLTFSWYDKVTNSMVTNISIPSSSGFTSYTENMGKVSNKGFEFDINYAVIQNNDWNFNISLKGAHNKNKILEISDALKEYNDRVDAFYSDYKENSPIFQNQQYIKPIRKYVEGGSETAIFGMKSLGIAPANGSELFMNRDGSVTYDWNPAEQVIIGNTEPVMHGIIAFNLRYKKLTMYSTFMYEWGGDIYNSTLVSKVESVDIWRTNVDKRVMTERWQQPGDLATMKSIKDRYTVTRPTSRFIQQNNYLSFNSLSIGYDMDQKFVKKIGLSMLRFQFTMNDIFRISTVKIERGTAYPYARTAGFTINASF